MPIDVEDPPPEPLSSAAPTFCSRFKGGLVYFKNVLAYEYPPDQPPPAYLFFKNRWFRGTVILLMCLFNTIIYYGWQPFQKMLYRGGAYRWLCDPLEENEYCPAQYSSVQTLYTTALSSEFVFGAFAGVSFDYLGPFLTAIFGCTAHLLGWICLACSSQTVQFYIPAMILSAGSVNFIAYPAFCLADLFPRWPALSLALVVAAQTTCTLVAPVMKVFWDAHLSYSFRDIITGYVLVCFLPLTFFFLLSIPWRRPNNSTKDSKPEDKTVEELTPEDKTGDHHVSGSTEPRSSECHYVSTLSASSVVPPLSELSSPPTSKKSDSSCISVTRTPWQRFCSAMHLIVTPDYGLFTLYYLLQSLQYGYYPQPVEKRWGASISDFQGWLLGTQGVFGALFGVLVEKTTTLPICFGLVIAVSGARSCFEKFAIF